MAIDMTAPVPPYEQIREQLARAIEDGTLVPATKLPTVRQLAADLDLAVNTVARAYRELESAGLIETRGRNGSFVTGGASPARRHAQRATADFLRKMRDLGFGDAEALAMLRREIEAQAVRGTAAT